MPFRPSNVLLSVGVSLGVAGAAAAADLPARAPSPTFVQVESDPGGFYFVQRNAAAFIDNTRFSVAGGRTQVQTRYETAVSTGLGVGYAFRPFGIVTTRVEGEFAYNQASVRTHSVNGVRIARIDSFGELQGFTGFGNVFFDLNLGRAMGAAPGGLLSVVKPFVGGGVGAANVELRKQGISATGTLVSADDTRFAWHADAGIGIDLTGLGSAAFKDTTLEFGYRRQEVADLRFRARDGTVRRSDERADMGTFAIRQRF